MLHKAFLLLTLFVLFSLSSTSMLKKSIVRRQIDPQYCHAIEGFECKCSYYRVTCTIDRVLPTPINILPNEQHEYSSVQLVITASHDIVVNDQTFEPVKKLYKFDADNVEFRIKFERFTALNLTSSGIFNRVFPDGLSAGTRKHLELEIYNPDVPPNDHPNLFKNLNVDSLEVYALYPFYGSFQQLFDGANVKYLRLSGGDIRSDIFQSFTGNIARVEMAKQASQLNVQNFPVYPAHELIINAFYITDFNSEHQSNYTNVRELRIYTQERIPANAFRNFPNIQTLSLSTEQDIDPQALNGLNKLEKLTIKDNKATVELLNSVPSVKEFEADFEKINENTQCQLLEKLANGQVAVQALTDIRECTCVAAYLDRAAGRYPCNAENCEYSSCAVIKNNYDETTGTFKLPPSITRSDGTDALRQREARIYTAPYQIPYEDQIKLQRGLPQTDKPLDKSDDQEDNQIKDDKPDSKNFQYPINITQLMAGIRFCEEHYPDTTSNSTFSSYDDLQEKNEDDDEIASIATNEDEDDDGIASFTTDEDDDDDKIPSITENEDEETIMENQPDIICINLSEYKLLDMILFGIGEEKNPTLYKNSSTKYFCGFRANVQPTKTKNLVEKSIKTHSNFSYDKVVETIVSTLSIHPTDFKPSEFKINIVGNDGVKLRVLVKNKF